MRLRNQCMWTGMMLLGRERTMRIQSLWRYLCLIMPATPRWASELSCEHSHYPASHGLWPHATTGLCHCHFRETGSSMGLEHHCPPVWFWSIWNILNETTTFWACSKTHSQIHGFWYPLLPPLLIRTGSHAHAITPCQKALCINMT